MATLDNQLGWPPLEESKDCSHGFCTLYCPQWCYIIFPPPPPFSLSNDEQGSGKSFSPLVIAIIGILATAFLLVSYYTVVSKYRNSLLLHGHHRRPSDQTQQEEDSGEQPQSWILPSTDGLDEALVAKITVCRYKIGEGLVDGTDCSVCLSEFREGESLRLLPKCSHAFHLHCIDTWLRSHSNCPLCRASIVVHSWNLERRMAPASDNEQERVFVGVEDLDLESNEGEVNEVEEEEEEESEVGNGGYQCKDFGIFEIKEEDERILRCSASMGSASPDLVLCIANELKIRMKDLYTQRGGGDLARPGVREKVKGRWGRRRRLHSVMWPVQMKRSVSSGRSCFGLRRRATGINWSRTFISACIEMNVDHKVMLRIRGFDFKN